MNILEAQKKGIIKSEWHAYWLAVEYLWYISLGAKKERFRLRQHLKKEISHYAEDTWDLEYEFPFGWKELLGIANRTDFDLQQHIKNSKSDLTLFDEESKKKIVPHVIAEPSLGVERSFYGILLHTFVEDKERGWNWFKLPPKIAPFIVSVLPLVKKDGLEEKAKKIFQDLKKDFDVFFDSSGSIGRRYARSDEIGVPFAITVDYDTMEDNTVTIRDRDTAKQDRIKIEDLKKILSEKLD